MNVNPVQIPSLESLKSYNVNRANAVEGIRASLYDFQTYAQAGQTGLDFFQVPQGQGGKTLADTNMEIAGSLPNPKHFLALNLQVYFFPAGDISQFGAQAAAENQNDVYDVLKSGYVELYIGSKNYVQEAPIGRFPPKTGMVSSSSLADATTAGADFQSRISYANMGGAVYELKPPILLMPTQNFRLSIKWPANVAISANARIGVVMEGIMYRLSQ